MGFDAAVVAQVERRAGLKRYAGHPLFVYAGFDTWIRHYDRSRPAVLGALRRRHGGRRRLPRPSASTRTRTPTSATGRSNLAPEATLDRGLAMVTVRTLAFARTMRIIGSALGNGQAPAHLALDRPPRRPHRAHGHRLRALPVPGRRRPPRRHRAPRDQPRARGPRPRDAGARGRAVSGRGREGDVGTLVTTASTPRSASQRMRSGSSQVQVLTASPAAWAMRTRSSLTKTWCGWTATWPRAAARSIRSAGSRPAPAAMPWRAGRQLVHAVDGGQVRSRTCRQATTPGSGIHPEKR